MTEITSLPGRSIEPTTDANRITALDVLRGFALLGILLVNVMGFSGVVAGQTTTSPADGVVDWFVRHGARGVFFSSFSILFGIGFAMQMARMNERSGAKLSLYGRRLVVLLMLGLLHRLLDPAEVLVNYAVCGGLLLLFRRVSSTAVLMMALILIPLPFLHTAVVSSRATPEAVTDAETPADDPLSWDPYRSAESIAVRSGGDFSDVVGYHVRFTTSQLSSSWVSYLWLTVPLPLMLFGMVIGRRKILATLDTHGSLIRKACWIGLVGSVIGRYAGSRLFAAAAVGGWNPWLAFPGEVSWVLGGYALAVGYGAGILLLLRTVRGRGILLPLRMVGRLALTNYLLQTVICTTVFYQYGLGFYGEVGSALAILIALGIFLTQMVFSAGWLRRYRFGPVEWVWRSATYRRVLSNAKATTD